MRMGILINIQVLPPNQSLKLTEAAIVDFAARQKNFLGKWRSLPRVWSTTDLAARRRSLAPVRYASLAAGEACSKENE